jgi:hypothetical protein
MLKYLNKRYLNIIGHQGLTHFVNNFLCFKCMIKQYVQCNHRRKLVDGTMTIVHSLNFLLWDEFGFIDSSIDHVSTPFSGLCGNYEGAAHKVKHAYTQQALYLGYVKDYSIRVKPIFTLNGLLMLFGPVSAQRADAGVLAMRNLIKFLVQLQQGCFITLAGAEVIYWGFGNLTFKLGLQCIQSY